MRQEGRERHQLPYSVYVSYTSSILFMSHSPKSCSKLRDDLVKKDTFLECVPKFYIYSPKSQFTMPRWASQSMQFSRIFNYMCGPAISGYRSCVFMI